MDSKDTQRILNAYNWVPDEIEFQWSFIGKNMCGHAVYEICGCLESKWPIREWKASKMEKSEVGFNYMSVFALSTFIVF